MLHINNACIAFGTEVLFSGFEMKLEKGETACIVGQSGCGKTSLLNAVMGFVPLYEGTIKVGGTLLDKSTIDLVRRQIAWIPQELALPFEWVKEMVSLPFELKVNRSVPFSEERLFMCFDELVPMSAIVQALSPSLRPFCEFSGDRKPVTASAPVVAAGVHQTTLASAAGLPAPVAEHPIWTPAPE